VTPAADTESAAEARPRPFHPLSSGWIPAAAVAAATAATVLWYGVTVRDLVAFAAYSIVGVTLPGTLLWRALHGRSGTFAVDVAAGTALGIAVEVGVYAAARALGAPLAVLAFPGLTIAAFVAVPGLRGHWRGGGARLPAGVAWSTAGIAVFLLARSAELFRGEGLTGAAAQQPNVDVPFQFALVGELKHHMPPTASFVHGEPLLYHWFVHAHAAAVSWVTGIEPQVLILRLLVLPFLAAFLVLVVGIAKEVSGRWWPGPVALLLTFLGTSTDPFRWTSSPIFDGTIQDTFWLSPTMTLAATLFAAAMLALIGLLRGPNRRPGAWITLGVLVGGVAGAKATFTPMLTCAMVVVVAVRLAMRRRPGPELAALGIVVLGLAFTRYVLLAGANYGTVFAPLALIKWTGLGQLILGPPAPANPWWVLVGLTGLAALGCALAWAGAVGLLRRPWRADPAVLLMAVVALAGFGAAYLLAHPGIGSVYFARSGRPYACLIAAIGLAALLPAADRLTRRARIALAGLCALAVVLGVATVYAIRATVGRDRPSGPQPLREVSEPYLVLVAVLLALAAVLVLAARALRMGGAATVAVVAVLIAATSLSSGIGQIEGLIRLATSGQPLRHASAEPVSIPDGGITAMRWLRDNSAPDDLLATNSHCRFRPARTFCDSRDYWVTAFSERHVLIEGWSYSERTMKEITLYSRQLATRPYWDPAGLAENDAVFTEPTAATVAAMAERHHVRWLVAVGTEVSPDLGRYATLRFSSGAVSVFEITAS
jgi:hypothetical protein